MEREAWYEEVREIRYNLSREQMLTGGCLCKTCFWHEIPSTRIYPQNTREDFKR